MTHNPQSTYSAYDDFLSNDKFAADEFVIGERIGDRLPSVARVLVRKLAALAMIGGVAFACVKTRDIWWPMLTEQAAKLQPGPPAEKISAKEPEKLAQLPAAPRNIADAPGVSAGTAVPEKPAPATTPAAAQTAAADTQAQAAEGEDTPAEASKPEPLPPLTYDDKDPLKKRAVAAGLHPDVSRALLAKMSPADFKNAASAIQKAIATTPDSETLTWPRERSPELALFEVHFVAGAPANCRRYVVTVTKDRWSTTAHPMEKCGVKAPERHAQVGRG